MTAVAVAVKSKAALFTAEFEQKWARELQPLCGKGFGTDRILAGTIAAAVTTPAIFECSKQSIYLSLLKVARWGLDVGEGVYLVPYKGTCTAVPSYTGLIALARRQKLVRHIEAYPVYAGDEFDYAYGSPGHITHRPGAVERRGKLIAAYAIIILPGGIERWHVMPIEDIEAIRSKSQQWSRAKIGDCPPWYAQKTVVRNYLNKQPKSGALADALGADAGETPEMATGTSIVPVATPPSAAEAVVVAASSSPADYFSGDGEGREPGEEG